ncbi:MAG: primosomal protein N' [Bacteroidales bacterium]|nr:primosomal protein N' [Bacteroidales bacterium]
MLVLWANPITMNTESLKNNLSSLVFLEKSEQNTDMYVDVILPLAVPLYTYRVPESMQSSVQIGCRVIVQLGTRKMYTAIVYSLHYDKPETAVIKEIDSVLDEKPIVTAKQLEFWDWLSDYYMCKRGEVMKAALPSGLKLESEAVLSVNSDFDCMTLSESDQCAYSLIEKNEGITLFDLAKTMGRKSVTTMVQRLVSLNAVVAGETISNQYKPKIKTYVKFAKPPTDKSFVDMSFTMVAKAAKQQETFLKLLNLYVLHKEDEDFALEKSEFLKQTTPAVLSELQKKGIIVYEDRIVSRFDQSIQSTKDLASLSDKQQVALDEILSSFETKQTCLLHGVTSSGKTEIYIHLIQKMIDEGKQVLYLLPEIALTSQIINRLRSVFGSQVGIYHSKFSDNERIEVWNNLLANNESSYKVILGVRSSIFLPFNDLGLIIVDEEHETSFKQYDPSPRYNARDMAYILGQKYEAKVLLGTATPSMETYYNVLTNRVSLVELKARHTKAPLPEIHIVDLRMEHKHKRMHDDVFSKTMLEKINENLSENKQIILFQNRRGFSPYLECPDCGYVPQCINCDVSLTYHKFSNMLMCHHCGYAVRYAVECPECHQKNVRLVGFGTEKIEDTLKEIFPQARIARMDLDTTRGKNAYSELIDKFEKKEIDILVGTQMITKGLDFENVGMVGILSADSLLRFPEFRAFERAYHLMVQVAGRAGRSATQGHVYIQTYQPEHPILKFVKENDYQSLLNTQMAERKTFWYPPFTRLIKVTIKNRDVEKVKVAAKFLADDFRKIQGIIVLGPEFPPIPRIQLLYAQDILLKIPRNMNIVAVKNEIRRCMDSILTLEEYKTTTFSINVDPY